MGNTLVTQNSLKYCFMSSTILCELVYKYRNNNKIVNSSPLLYFLALNLEPNIISDSRKDSKSPVSLLTFRWEYS